MKAFIIVNTLGNVFLWLLFVVSDAVILGVLNLIGIIVTLLINAKQNKKISEVKVEQAVLAKNIDGKMDELLAANKRADVAEGTATGRAEVHSEQATAAAAIPGIPDKPIEVVVIENKDKEVVIKNKEDEPVPVKPTDEIKKSDNK